MTDPRLNNLRNVHYALFSLTLGICQSWKSFLKWATTPVPSLWRSQDVIIILRDLHCYDCSVQTIVTNHCDKRPLCQSVSWKTNPLLRSPLFFLRNLNLNISLCNYFYVKQPLTKSHPAFQTIFFCVVRVVLKLSGVPIQYNLASHCKLLSGLANPEWSCIRSLSVLVSLLSLTAWQTQTDWKGGWGWARGADTGVFRIPFFRTKSSGQRSFS